MKRVETNKAKEIEKILSEMTGETVQIRYGSPDARYPVEYYAYAITCKGFQSPGTYGNMIRKSKTLKGLLKEV